MPFLHENLIREACDCADEPHRQLCRVCAAEEWGAVHFDGHRRVLVAVQIIRQRLWACRWHQRAHRGCGAQQRDTPQFEGRDRASRLTPHVSRIIYGSSAAILALLERESD